MEWTKIRLWCQSYTKQWKESRADTWRLICAGFWYTERVCTLMSGLIFITNTIVIKWLHPSWMSLMMLEIVVEVCCPPCYASKQIIAVEKTRISTCLLYVLHLLDWVTLRRYIWVFFWLDIHMRTLIRDSVSYPAHWNDMTLIRCKSWWSSSRKGHLIQRHLQVWGIWSMHGIGRNSTLHVCIEVLTLLWEFQQSTISSSIWKRRSHLFKRRTMPVILCGSLRRASNVWLKC